MLVKSHPLLFMLLYSLQKLVSSLHTIVMFITAYAKLGDKFCLKLKSKRSRGASWSGAEHFGQWSFTPNNLATMLSLFVGCFA